MNTQSKARSNKITKFSREEIANFLIEVTKKKKIIEKTRKQFQSHPKFSAIFDTEYIKGIVNITIAKTINAHEVFVAIKNKDKKFLKSVPEEYTKIKKTTKLHTKEMITGYFLNAFKNNLSKDYSKYKKTKRNGDTVSYESTGNESNELSAESITVFNQLKTNPIEDFTVESDRKIIFSSIIHHLRQKDKENNLKNPEEKSNLAYIFLYMINPHLKGKYILIKERISITQYQFKKDLNEISKIIKTTFGEHSDFLYDYLSANLSNEKIYTKTPKINDIYYNQSCDVSSCFEIKNDNKNFIVKITVNLTRINNGRREVLKSESFSKKTNDLSKIDLIKSELEISSEKKLAEYRKEANELKMIYFKSIK